MSTRAAVVLGAAVLDDVIGLIILAVVSLPGYYFFVEYEFLKILPLVGIATIAIIANVFVDQSFVEWRPEILIYKMLLCLIFVTGLLIFKVITPEHFQFILVYLKTWFKRFKPAPEGYPSE